MTSPRVNATRRLSIGKIRRCIWLDALGVRTSPAVWPKDVRVPLAVILQLTSP